GTRSEALCAHGERTDRARSDHEPVDQDDGSLGKLPRGSRIDLPVQGKAQQGGPLKGPGGPGGRFGSAFGRSLQGPAGTPEEDSGPADRSGHLQAPLRQGRGRTRNPHGTEMDPNPPCTTRHQTRTASEEPETEPMSGVDLRVSGTGSIGTGNSSSSRRPSERFPTVSSELSSASTSPNWASLPSRSELSRPT